MYDSYHQHSASTSSSSGVDPKAEPESSSAQVAAATAAAAGGAATAAAAALTPQQQQQQQFAQEFWEEQIIAAEQFDSDFKNHPLPLARIKKVMKSDPEVKVRKGRGPLSVLFIGGVGRGHEGGEWLLTAIN